MCHCLPCDLQPPHHVHLQAAAAPALPPGAWMAAALLHYITLHYENLSSTEPTGLMGQTCAVLYSGPLEFRRHACSTHASAGTPHQHPPQNPGAYSCGCTAPWPRCLLHVLGGEVKGHVRVASFCSFPEEEATRACNIYACICPGKRELGRGQGKALHSEPATAPPAPAPPRCAPAVPPGVLRVCCAGAHAHLPAARQNVLLLDLCLRLVSAARLARAPPG